MSDAGESVFGSDVYVERNYFTLEDIELAKGALLRGGFDPEKAEFRFYRRPDLDGHDPHDLNVYISGQPSNSRFNKKGVPK